MKSATQFLVAITVMLGASIAIAQTYTNGKYTCKSYGDEVCAVSNSTGQCTTSWDKEDGGNPMFFCKKFIGLKVSNYDKSNYYCKDMGNYTCAKSLSTGQCTNSWSNKDGGMSTCQSFLGLAGKVDHSNYSCKKTANGYCAQSNTTGQCTHEWSNKDGDALYACQNWISK
jgi:hypothetical protein